MMMGVHERCIQKIFLQIIHVSTAHTTKKIQKLGETFYNPGHQRL